MTEPTPTQTRPPRKRRRGLWIGLTVAAVVLVGTYAGAVWRVSGDVPAGTTVLGVPIGGMSTEQAVETLRAELGSQATAAIPVTAGQTSTKLSPTKAGLSADWQATVEGASGLILRPAALIAHLRGDVAVTPVTTVDKEALANALASLADVVDVPAQEPAITYTGTVAKLEPGQDGSSLDIQASTALVAAQYLQSRDLSVALPVQTVKPTVPAAKARQVLTTVAEPAVATPVTLAVDSAKIQAAPSDIAEALTFSVANGTLKPSLDGDALHEALAAKLAALESPGRDAAFRISDGHPVVVPSKAGRSVNPDALAAAVLAVLPQTDAAKRVATVKVTATQPDFTTADAKALNITEQLSSFYQWFPPAAYRYQNVGQAAEYLNGTIIKPGATFSMNETIKERTVANGYTTGYIIQGGRFREELGGGVSIITTATWTAGFYAGLDRIEQHPHGLYIDRYEAGLEATVAWGLLDLKLRNSTGNGVLITATRYPGGVRVSMWGTKKYDRVTATFTPRHSYTDYSTIYDDKAGCVPSDGVRGFSIAVTRRLITNGVVQRAETWPTTYRPTPHVVCGSKPGT